MTTWLVYGGKGWIGSYVCQYIRNHCPSISLKLATKHIKRDNASEILGEIDECKPDRVVSFIGRTSGPGNNTIDFLEQKDKLVDNIQDNLFAPLVLMKLCESLKIHFTQMGTGCVFSYILPSDPPFDTNATPNFFGSSYSIVKGFTDQISRLFPNMLNVRIRMPITEIDEPKNFITKIAHYPQICNTLNSMSVLPDLVPILIVWIQNKETGTVNMVNPKPTDHRSILALYQQFVDNDHVYQLMSEEEQNAKLLAQRSKNVLVSSCPQAPSTLVSIKRILTTSPSFQMSKKRQRQEQNLKQEVIKSRLLGSCKKCKKNLVEFCHNGFWAYNCHLEEKDQIIFSGSHYYCRSCASPNMIKKHNKTF